MQRHGVHGLAEHHAYLCLHLRKHRVPHQRLHRHPRFSLISSIFTWCVITFPSLPRFACFIVCASSKGAAASWHGELAGRNPRRTSREPGVLAVEAARVSTVFSRFFASSIAASCAMIRASRVVSLPSFRLDLLLGESSKVQHLRLELGSAGTPGATRAPPAEFSATGAGGGELPGVLRMPHAPPTAPRTARTRGGPCGLALYACVRREQNLHPLQLSARVSSAARLGHRRRRRARPGAGRGGFGPARGSGSSPGSRARRRGGNLRRGRQGVSVSAMSETRGNGRKGGAWRRMRRPRVRSGVSRVRRRVARVTNAVPRARKDDAGARATRARHRDARADASGPAPQIAKRSARVVEREKMKRESDAGEQRRAGTRDVTRLGRARGALARITRDDRYRFATVRPAGRRSGVAKGDHARMANLDGAYRSADGPGDLRLPPSSRAIRFSGRFDRLARISAGEGESRVLVVGLAGSRLPTRSSGGGGAFMLFAPFRRLRSDVSRPRCRLESVV